MNFNIKFLLLGTSLSLIPTLTNAQCVATTGCSDLGYTEKSCPDGKGIKCPFGNTFACPATDKSVCEKYGFKYTCTGTGYTGGAGQSCNNKYASCICNDGFEWKDGKCEEKTGGILGQCTGYAKNCKIGDILNSDGVCTTDKVSNKTPIGVVVYISSDGNCGQAMAPDIIKGGNRYTGWDVWDWALEDYFRDIGSIDNINVVADAIEDFKSCQNTAEIIKQGNANEYPAVWAAHNYMSNSAENTKSKWCLPALGVLNAAHKYRAIINQSFTKISGKTLGENDTGSQYYWSSTEISYDRVWSWDSRTGNLSNGLKQGGSGYGTDGIGQSIRPVIEF